MDAGTLRGIFTVVMMLLFIAICIWAYSGKRKADFDSAANLPLESDDAINDDVRTQSEKVKGANS